MRNTVSKLLSRKKGLVIIGIGFFLIAVLVLAIVQYKSSLSDISQDENPTWENYKTTSLEIEGKTYSLLVADTPVKSEKGLMFVRKPTDVQGMVFQYQDSSTRFFWNKNTFVDLQLIWMNEGEVVGKSDLPSIEKSKTIVTVQSPRPADTVVEIIK